MSRTVTLATAHKNEYRDPSLVVHCKPGDAGGNPYAQRQYRAVAEAFADGRVIENWKDSGSFTIGEQRYQVVASRRCIDVISRGKRRAT